MSTRPLRPSASPSSPIGFAVKRLGSLLAVLVALPQASSHAAENSPSQSPVPSVVVSPPKCEEDSFPTVAFLDSLRVELAGRGVNCCTLATSDVPTVGNAALLVRIEELGPCGAESERVRVEVQQLDGSRALDREISLADITQTARPRALALAVAELIRSLAQEAGEQTPKPVPNAPQRPQSKPKPVEAPRSASAAYGAHLDGELRIFPARDTTLWGGRARVTAHGSSIHADVDLGANFSDVRTRLGELHLRSASIGFGLGPRFASAAVALDLGPRAEVGWAWIRGTTSLPSIGMNTGSGAIANAGFRASLLARADSIIMPCVTLEAGAVIQGLNGNVDGKVTAGIAGYYILSALGLSVPL